jgi:hypothetical protein
MSHWRMIWLFAALIGLTHDARGDLAPQRSTLPKPPLVAPVKVVAGNVDELDPNVAAKIIIPGNLLPELQESSRRTQVSNGSPSNGMTIVAGLALTAAAISLMFANKTSPHWRKGAIGLIVCVVLLGSLMLAKTLLPPKIDSSLVDSASLQKLIVIEVQEHGHEVTLVLPSGKVSSNED